jgi:uncharacterized membrane protein HdeD (DUF308 family)
MAAKSAGLLGAGRRLLQREAARWWWVPLVAAVVWFIIAWLVLRANYTSLATVGVLVGVVFLVALVNEVGVAAVMTGGWRVAHIALGALYLLGALWGFIRPINTFFALASVLGLLLFLQGVSYLIRGVALRDETPYWWLDVVSGGLLTLLALWVSSSDRMFNLAGRAAFILLWVGFMAIFRGVSAIMLAFALRSVAQGVPPSDALGLADDGPLIPAQERRSVPERAQESSDPATA